MQKSLVVLAAGMGSRYGGLKQMDPVGPSGEFILDYSVKFSLDAGFDKVVFVIRKDIETDFRNIVGKRWENATDVHYAIQDIADLPAGFSVPPERTKPWGTAHAVLATRGIVNEPFSVVNADDFYGKDAFRLTGEFLGDTAADSDTYCMVAFRLDKTLSRFGTVSRGVCNVSDDGTLLGITEHLEIARGADGVIRDGDVVLADNAPASMNLFGFKRSFIDRLEENFPAFLAANAHIPKAEYQMPTELDKFLAAGSVKVNVIRTNADWFGITSREDREQMVDYLKNITEKILDA